MKFTEAYEAFSNAINDIKNMLTDSGFDVNFRCYTADRDLNELSEDASNDAALIAAEITVGANGTDKKMILESALSITDTEVSPEEIRNEIGLLRKSAKEICDKQNETGDFDQTFKSFETEEEPIPEGPKYDNKKFYIGGAIAIVALIILVILFK